MPHDRDHRLLLGEPADGVVHGLAAGRGAPGAVDVEDHRLDLVGLADLVEQLAHLAVVGDDARHGHAGDVRQEAGGAGPALAAQHERAEEEEREAEPRRCAKR